MRKWQTIFDWGSDEMLEMRRVRGRMFQFIEVIDMDAVCGRDNEGQPKYAAELAIVDLDELSPADISSAMQSCGWEGMPMSDDALAEVCRSYGLKAPVSGASGNNWRKLQREMRSEAHALLDDSALADAMEQPVNRLGSTAAEYMRGDLRSAMARGVVSGDPSARVMAKMHGVDQDAIDDARPSDWLPYFMGYMSGFHGNPAETGDDVAPEYHWGYQRGERQQTEGSMKVQLTYEVVTEESAEHGTSADHGFYEPGGWRYSIADDKFEERAREIGRLEALREMTPEPMEFDNVDGLVSAVECYGPFEASSYPNPTIGDRLTGAEDMDYSTGGTMRVSVHLEDVTEEQLREIFKALGAL